MATTVAPADVEPQSLMQAAHETAGLDDIVAAYAAMELKGKFNFHVRPDETVFILRDVAASSFGKGNDASFAWGIGPIDIEATMNTAMLTIAASVGIKIPFLGRKELVSISGDLNKGVTAGFDAWAAKGSVTFFLKGKELWVTLKVSSPFFNISKDFKIFTICKLSFAISDDQHTNMVANDQ
ncbi:hypothetical protein BDV93DRAFT_561903 [Ceratobasidium sp. AG-I]|nr:hypothetical protein BDV93DRAFT_561903 [Ceratobasidium sp. AG-I]